MTADSVKEYQIPMTDKVAKEIRKAKNESPFFKEGFFNSIEIVLLVSSFLWLLLVLVWYVFDFLLTQVSSINLGWSGSYKGQIMLSIFLFSLLSIIIIFIKFDWRSPETKKEMEKDLDARVIDVYEYPIYEVKVFEEIERGGLFYFLKTVNDKILVLYDYDSTYQIRDVYKVSKTPNAQYLVGEQFYGELIEIPEVKRLKLDNGIWPEHSEFVECDWCDVESRFWETS